MSRRRSVRVTKRKYPLKGGPFDGERVWLSCPGTLRMRHNNRIGFYTRDNFWVEEESHG